MRDYWINVTALAGVLQIPALLRRICCSGLRLFEWIRVLFVTRDSLRYSPQRETIASQPMSVGGAVGAGNGQILLGTSTSAQRTFMFLIRNAPTPTLLSSLRKLLMGGWHLLPKHDLKLELASRNPYTSSRPGLSPDITREKRTRIAAVAYLAWSCQDPRSWYHVEDEDLLPLSYLDKEVDSDTFLGVLVLMPGKSHTWERILKRQQGETPLLYLYKNLSLRQRLRRLSKTLPLPLQVLVYQKTAHAVTPESFKISLGEDPTTLGWHHAGQVYVWRAWKNIRMCPEDDPDRELDEIQDEDLRW